MNKLVVLLRKSVPGRGTNGKYKGPEAQSWLVSGTAKSLCGWSGLKGERVVEYDIIVKEPGHIQKWPSTF